MFYDFPNSWDMLGWWSNLTFIFFRGLKLPIRIFLRCVEVTGQWSRIFARVCWSLWVQFMIHFDPEIWKLLPPHPEVSGKRSWDVMSMNDISLGVSEVKNEDVERSAFIWLFLSMLCAHEEFQLDMFFAIDALCGSCPPGWKLVYQCLSFSLTRDLVYHKPSLPMGHDHFLGDTLW